MLIDSRESSAKDILRHLQVDKIRRELKSLSTDVVLNKCIGKENSNTYGKVYVSEVSVVYEKKELSVVQKVCKFFTTKACAYTYSMHYNMI